MCLLASAVMVAFANNKPTAKKQYVIKGTVKGITSGTVKLVYQNEDDHTSKIIDSGLITNGTFKLTGNIPTTRMMSVVLEPGKCLFFNNNNVIVLKS